MGKRWFGFSAAAVMMMTPALAQAQSCSDLQTQLNATHGELGGIAYEYPKTHLAIIACIVGNDARSDQDGCVSTVIFGACIGLGPDGCTDLMTRWARVTFKYFTILPQMKAIGCRP